ncbi:MAG TPA: amidase family protein [Acidimicrobiales bacterium]|nr:amidase family protein [Acidimicrobiales bacterium]
MTLDADLQWIDATETADLISRKEVTALEVVEAAIARAERLQPKLNFLVTDAFDNARERAGGMTGADERAPFPGVPFLVKDMYDVAGLPTRWGARFGPLLPPAAANSPQVDAYQAAGLLVIGKSALGEIGFLPTTEPLVSGPTRNPWDLDLSPGGSSGGSAAAVAAGVVPFADAADGGGSIRIPASACGLFGLKPSTGRLVGHQDAAGGYPLTVEHCLSRSVRDSAALFAFMERNDLPAGLPRVGAVVGPSKRRLRIALIAESLGGRNPEGEVASALDKTAGILDRMGHRVEATSYPFDAGPIMADFSVLYATAALGVRDLVAGVAGAEPDETLLEPFTLAMAAVAAALPAGALEETKSRLEAVVPLYDSLFGHSLLGHSLLGQSAPEQSAPEQFDLVLSPVTLTPPIPIGYIDGGVPFDELVTRIGGYADYTVLHNIVGAPAMSMPLHWTADRLPVGLQFAARIGNERTLFELAYELEEAEPWRDRRPPIFTLP